ncbi:MAG: hypothetical protein JJT96_13835 [Opitutales bacterium]|nr:hypothetical protein [Opitutales bacterium]
MSYCRAHRSDVCISSDSTVLHYLPAGALDVPGEIGFASRDVQDNQPKVSDLRQGPQAVGAAGAY